LAQCHFIVTGWGNMFICGMVLCVLAGTVNALGPNNYGQSGDL